MNEKLIPIKHFLFCYQVLFQKELDKAYDPNKPEDDMVERAEESERMREHVMKETDKNNDRMISFDEFMDQTKKEEFNKHDETWDGVDDIDDDFSDEEFTQFEHERQAEIQAMLDKGQVPEGYPYFGETPEGGVPYHLPQDVVPGQVPGQAAFNPKQPEGRAPVPAQPDAPSHQAVFQQPETVQNNNHGVPPQVNQPVPVQGQQEPLQGSQGQPQFQQPTQ